MTIRSRAQIAAMLLSLLLAGASGAVAQTDPHAGHQQDEPKPPATAGPVPPYIAPVTEEDRRAAFPDVQGHTVHDNAVNYLVLLDQFEWQSRDGANLNTRGWVGRDRDRLWFRVEGDGADGRMEDAQVHALYGRMIARWWDLVAGVRQDFQPGPAQTWAAVGVQGLAPYWFEVEATGYVGASGRTEARVEVEYELLFTNRLILQPRAEVDVAGRSDPERGVGAGVSTTELGFRLRYEFRRELAPYVGVTWNNKWGKTADLAEAAGKDRGGTRFVTGLRLWF